MTTQDTPEQPHRKCGLIHEGQFCTQPATIKLPVISFGPDAWTYVCDFHAGQIVGEMIKEQEEQQQ